MLPLLSAAWAFEVAERAAWSLPAEGAAVGVADGHVFVGGATGLWALGADGALLGGVEVAVDDLLLRDADADGFLEVWTCGGEGLAVTTWDGDALGAPAPVSTAPCLALAETADGIATADSIGVALWTDDGAGGLSGPEDAGVTLTGAPLLACVGQDVAAATVGDTALQVVGTLGVSTQAAGGPVADLLGGEAWTWLVTDPPGVARASGFVADLPAEPARLAIGEVDGDLLDDFVVLQADGGVAIARGTGDGATFPGEGDAVALLELTGDGCADVLLLDGDQLRVLAVTGCAGHLDGDADGWSPDAGDCDDADPSVSPGASDACNDADDDCDGEVDEWDGDLALEVRGGLEGSRFTVDPGAAGCLPADLLFDWTVTATFDAECRDSGQALSCLAADQGTAHVRGWIETAPEIAAEADVVVENVAPELIVPSGGCADSIADGEVSVYPGERYTELLEFYEPGDDVVTAELRGEPFGMSIADDGWFSYQVGHDTGTWGVELELADEDSGLTTYELLVHVRGGDGGWSWWSDDTGGSAWGGGCEEESEPAPACGCGCCGSSSFVFVLFPVVGWWRRRDPPRDREGFDVGITSRRRT